MTVKPPRIILDTNIVLSAVLWPSSVPGLAFRKAFLLATLLQSPALQDEYEDVFRRPKFDAYAALSVRLNFLKALARRSDPIIVGKPIAICRDPKDNMLLELALSGNADIIVTGDRDLLSLHPWRGVAILMPRDYLER